MDIGYLLIHGRSLDEGSEGFYLLVFTHDGVEVQLFAEDDRFVDLAATAHDVESFQLDDGYVGRLVDGELLLC